MLVNPKKITERMTQKVVEIDDPRLNMMWNKYIKIAGDWAIALSEYYKEATDPINKYNKGKVLMKAKAYGDASYEVIVLQHEIMELLQYFVQHPPFTDVDRKIFELKKQERPDVVGHPIEPKEPIRKVPQKMRKFGVTELPQVMQEKIKKDVESGNITELWGTYKAYCESVFREQGIKISYDSFQKFISRKLKK